MQISSSRLDIQQLPSETLVNIFDFLDERTLRIVQRVSKVFYQIASEGSLWKKFVAKRLGLTLGDVKSSNYTYYTYGDSFGTSMHLQGMSRELTPDMPIHMQLIEYEKQYYRFFRTIFYLEQSEHEFDVQSFIKNYPNVARTHLTKCIAEDVAQRTLEMKCGCPQRGHSLELGLLLYAGITPTLENIQDALANESSLSIMSLLLNKIDERDRQDVKTLLLYSPHTTLEIFETAIKNGYLFYKSDLVAFDTNKTILNYLQEHALPDPNYFSDADTDEWGGNEELVHDPEVIFTSLCEIQ